MGAGPLCKSQHNYTCNSVAHSHQNLPGRQTLELSPLTDGYGGVEVVDEVLQRVHHVGVHVVEGDGQVAAAVQTLNTVYPSLICYGLKYIDQ